MKGLDFCSKKRQDKIGRIIRVGLVIDLSLKNKKASVAQPKSRIFLFGVGFPEEDRRRCGV